MTRTVIAGFRHETNTFGATEERLSPRYSRGERWASARPGMALAELVELTRAKGEIEYLVDNGTIELSGPIPLGVRTTRPRPRPRRAKKGRRRTKNKTISKPTSDWPTKMRECLSCNAEFESWGPGNRLCNECRRLSENPFELNE